MNNRPILITVGVIALIVIGAVGWYLGSPLFINRTVDEAFPFELPGEAEIAQMSDAEKEALVAEFEAAVPSDEELANLSPEEQAQVQEKVMDAAEAMPDKMMEEPMPEAAATEPVVIVQGQFQDADDFHQGSGHAAVYQLPDGRWALRFEEFMVTNGPDLHVILSKHPAPATHEEVGTDYLDLGQLKGNIGNQNYEIPADVDLSAYQSIVIYCVPFHVVFATATLN